MVQMWMDPTCPLFCSIRYICTSPPPRNKLGTPDGPSFSDFLSLGASTPARARRRARKPSLLWRRVMGLESSCVITRSKSEKRSPQPLAEDPKGHTSSCGARKLTRLGTSKYAKAPMFHVRLWGLPTMALGSSFPGIWRGALAAFAGAMFQLQFKT